MIFATGCGSAQYLGLVTVGRKQKGWPFPIKRPICMHPKTILKRERMSSKNGAIDCYDKLISRYAVYMPLWYFSKPKKWKDYKGPSAEARAFEFMVHRMKHCGRLW